ncbi:kinase-like protein [Lentithecium fluviatile CBS 122367]|uniref:Kinase-like protein n=1 Tax=Lentithecium fluviatile CBS 122367 TaxID=1168545 RepID=A0A6G1JE18_9PLEO|nr:kinase-like protein [Lentithecium fluviatile CBS 122367]
MLRSAFDRHRKFLPQGRIQYLITEKAVKGELDRYEHSLRKRLQIWKRLAGTENNQKRARTICGESAEAQQETSKGYRKIFATLLLIDQPLRINAFIKNGVSDRKLPLLGRGAVARFEELQWAFLSPVFKRIAHNDIPHIEIQYNEILLPFVEWEKMLHGGRFAQVYRADIHSEHHAFNHVENRSGLFAVKEIFNNTREEEIKKEINVLKGISSSRHSHSHLVTLLATFRYHDHYHLIFPWAKYDLLGYWEHENPNPEKNAETTLWFAEQCRGLADALYKIHHWMTRSESALHDQGPNPPTKTERLRAINTSQECAKLTLQLFGRHGDIKPQNILWFPNEGLGILKITDFGSAHFSTRESDPAQGDSSPSFTRLYRAPEDDLPNLVLTPSYDIWSLGCVYLEFVTWFLGGWKSFDSFAENRLAPDPQYPSKNWEGISFFQRLEGDESGVEKAKVKNVVTEQIKSLRSDPACTPFFLEFLNMVQNDMLVIKPANPNGVGPRRKTAREIMQDVSDMKIRLKRGIDIGYF